MVVYYESHESTNLVLALLQIVFIVVVVSYFDFITDFPEGCGTCGAVDIIVSVAVR